jgi:Competence protein CoiA-like family
MLTAWDIKKESILALPDCEDGAELNAVRDWARAGKVVCPVCREKLWLRVGEKRCPHLAHRVLADCPHAHVSVAIIEARRLLYRFFQERIQLGKLAGPIELEPTVPGLPDNTHVDLILRRDPKQPVAIVLLDAGLKPNQRYALRSAIRQQSLIFRPVFLISMLKPKKEADGVFLLNPTQRDLTHKSLFGRCEDDFGMRDALHFVDYKCARWTSLRGLWLEHPPQVYRTESVRHSPMSELLWSEGQADWTHPGEPKAKKAPPAFTPLPQRRSGSCSQEGPPAPSPVEPPEWMTSGLICIGCHVRTKDWLTATPGADRCVCKTCFAMGVR